VRDQLSPSPVDHEENTVRLNQWLRFIENKIENIQTFSHSILFPIIFVHPLQLSAKIESDRITISFTKNFHIVTKCQIKVSFDNCCVRRETPEI